MNEVKNMNEAIEVLTPDFGGLDTSNKGIKARIKELILAYGDVKSARLGLLKIALAAPEKQDYVLEQLMKEEPDLAPSLRTYMQKIKAFDDAPYFRSMLVRNITTQQDLLKICMICGGGAKDRMKDDLKYAQALDLIRWPDLREAMDVLGRRTSLTAECAKDMQIPEVLKPTKESQKRGAYAPKIPDTTTAPDTAPDTATAPDTDRYKVSLGLVMLQHGIPEASKDALESLLRRIGGMPALATGALLCSLCEVVELERGEK